MQRRDSACSASSATSGVGPSTRTRSTSRERSEGPALTVLPRSSPKSPAPARFSSRPATRVRSMNDARRPSAAAVLRVWLDKWPGPQHAHHHSTVMFDCCDCGLNPSAPSDPLPMEPGARRGGWSRALKYCWPFIATATDTKQLDGTFGVHRPGECVYGMLWMGQAVGPESDHLSPWAQGATSLTKDRCRNCHAAKTTYEKLRSADKRSGIQRSPTAPIEQEDSSTTYDVDVDLHGGCRRGQTKLSSASGGVA